MMLRVAMLSDLIGKMRAVIATPAGWTIAAGWISRILTAAAQFYAVRLLTDLLGLDVYGGFAIVTGLLGWFALADFGFGSSLQNHISQQRVEGRQSTDAIASVFLLLMGATILLSILWYAIAGWAGPFLLANVDRVGAPEAARSFFLYATVATGTGASAVALKVLFAEHRGYLAHLLLAVGTYAGLALILAYRAVVGEPGLATVLLLYGAPNWILPAAYLAGHLHRLHGGASWIGRFDTAIVTRLWRRARVFLFYTALAACVLNIDYILISQTMPPQDVATYSVFTRLYALAFFVFSSVLSAYWPIVSELLHRREFTRIRSTARYCMVLGGLVVLATAGVVALFNETIARLLSPTEPLSLPLGFIPFFTIYWLLRVWTDTYAMLLHSANRTIILCFASPVQALINVALGYLGARAFGLPGLLAGMSLSFALTVTWLLPVYINRFVLKDAGDTHSG